jgi:hypothetical protein
MGKTHLINALLRAYALYNQKLWPRNMTWIEWKNMTVEKSV